MKRFLSMCLVALMIVSCVSVVAGAAAADWVPGNGAHLISKEDRSVIAENSPVTVSDGTDGVVVTHGGYYQTGDNWSGVASKDKYNINGLEVTVRFDTIPEVFAEDDCWICFDLLSQPFMFHVSDVPKNPGFMCLIRFGKGHIEIYDGVTAFKGAYNSQTDKPGFFSIKSGDVIKARWDYVTSPDIAYEITFTKNDTESFTLPYKATNLVDCFVDGKAHVVLNCNLLGSEKDAFKYTILEVKDGVEKTQEDIDAVDDIRAENERIEKETKANEKIAVAEEKVNKAVANATEANVADAIAKANEGVAAIDSAKAAVEAGNYDEVEGYCDAAKDAANDAEKMVRDYKKENGDNANSSEKAEQNDDATTSDNGEDNGNNIGLIIAIAAVIIVIAAIVVIVLKKKKN